MAPAVEASRAWMGEGTELFLRAMRGHSDDALAGPTALPGWTGKHVLAHVAANADALRNLVRWARTGEETPMYSSPEQRNANIADGAERAVPYLREWVVRSAKELEASLGDLTDEQWHREVRTAQGRLVPATEIRWMRTREVMIHAFDLSGSVGFRDMPAEFHAALLDDIVAKRSGAGDGPALQLEPTDDERRWDVAGKGAPTTVLGPLSQLAAYLSGRQATRLAAGAPADADALPELPRWL
ncbi:MAG: maleylpyruvate isomerase family mycothiol-dependent enzyme [Intrasporangium sp.]|uniref:maleylpyruvate isomerase family mycothiol-dependent enzyme n=1 Tax=Intrasporangium sp. TaxID=1925024 RepID=UPI00264760E9|nr:maleylpyruvate isomerase family mycothiol-dependent enzyme [Intrasporangium sp.]MDN5796406.1 maleylpyruvate isomerase family mycothiol-dependent enzyme [Intrasporangium sp.]